MMLLQKYLTRKDGPSSHQKRHGLAEGSLRQASRYSISVTLRSRKLFTQGLLELKKKLAAELEILVAEVQYDTPPFTPVPVRADDPVQVTIWLDELIHKDDPDADERLFKETVELNVDAPLTPKVFKLVFPVTFNPFNAP